LRQFTVQSKTLDEFRFLDFHADTALGKGMRLSVFCAVVLLSTWSRAADRIDFARDVQPILADTCWGCHGPDENTRQADLRLDSREAALPVLSPGNTEDSELFRRITSDDIDERMPPAEAKKQLTS
jgi:hypothetical protein